MMVYVTWDGDKIGRMVGRAVLDDDVEAVRRIDQSINAGNELWRSFALKHGGSVIEIGGDEGRVQVPASALSEVQGVARQYGTAVGATVSVGVAMKMSEAAKAQLVAKLRGGNQVLIWDPAMQEEITDAATPKTEGQKISDEYLGKAQPAAPHGDHGGFAGHEQPEGPAHGQKDHDETAVAQDEASAAPAPVEGTHAAADFEDQLHDLAGAQGEQDRQDAQAQSGHLDEVKDGLVRTLTVVRQQMPLIQQLQQTAPEVYASIMALVHGLVDLGREVMGPGRPAEDAQPVQKAEDLVKSDALRPTGDTPSEPGYAYHATNEERAHDIAQQGLQLHRPHEFTDQETWPDGSTQKRSYHSTKAGSVWSFAPEEGNPVILRTRLDTHPFKKESTGDLYSVKPIKPELMEIGMADGSWRPLKEWSAGELGKRELEKGGAGSSGGTEAGRAHLDLPAGTVKDGAIKVKHADGKTGWKQVRAGMIQGQEADAGLLGQNSHPVSSRSPSSH